MAKECGFLEQMVISIIMLPNILGRALCLGVIFSVTKIYGAIVLIILFASQLLLSSLECLVSKTQITSKMFLGILTSFTSPCLVVIEQSKHFLVNGISGSILNIMATWIIYLIVSTNLFPETSSTLECHHNMTTNSTTRCPVNPNTSTDDCQPGFFQISEQVFANFPENQRQWDLLLITNLIITTLLILGLASIAVLHYLINTDKRMMFLMKFGINICPERDTTIKPFIVQVMDGKRNFDQVVEDAKEATGKSILELMVQSRRIHLTKVSTYSR